MEFNATFLVSAVSFIVFVFIMNAILYSPLEKIVDERQKFIDDTNSAAKVNFDESDKILKDKEEKINETRQLAKKVVTEKTDEAKARKSDLQLEAQKSSVEKIERAKNDLLKSRDEAKEALSQNVQSLADEISSKILG